MKREDSFDIREMRRLIINTYLPMAKLSIFFHFFLTIGYKFEVFPVFVTTIGGFSTFLL